MYLWHLRLFRFLVVFLIVQDVQPNSWNTIYDKIHDNADLSMFEQILLENSVTKELLEYKAVTIFAPLNIAFQRYQGNITADLGLYHVCMNHRFNPATIEYLKTVRSLSLFNTTLPVWFTNVDGDIYVNQAKIIRSQSVYRQPKLNQYQALHVIDTVLDPMIKSTNPPPNAYDFLREVHKWNLGDSMLVTKFLNKVQLSEHVDLYHKAPNTFFIPINSGIDSYKYEMMNKKVMQGHVLYHQVVFSRPQGRILSNVDEDGTLRQFSFKKINNTLFIECVSNYRTKTSQYSVEVLVPDIPVQNGVVHLISEPLGNFFGVPTHFPYLPIIEKVTNDLEIDVFYKMGEVTGFNSIFHRKNVNFTYFIPTDSAWYKTSRLGLVPVRSIRNILSKHLVISKKPYSMQQLVSMTRKNRSNPIKLMSEKGQLQISVFETDGEYLIKWRKKYIKVLRPDYICTNGIVHILSGPFVNFRQRELERGYNSSYWKIVKDIGT